MSPKIHAVLGIFLLASLSRVALADELVTTLPRILPIEDRGIVILRSGQVLEGRIERTGDYYEISLPDQELRVRASDVEFRCRDFAEGYSCKRATIQPGNIQEHLRLAQWCERYGLLDDARNELAAATEIEPKNPMIAVIERRLKLAAEQPKTPGKLATPAEPARRLPSDEELDDMIRGMPAGTVEAFVKVIQPILINHCVSCGAMQPTSGRLEIMRPSVDQNPNRRMTQRNLYAVLQCIDWDDPDASRLLKSPSGPRGMSQSALYSDLQPMQLRRLREWVFQVVRSPLPTEAPEAVAGSGPEISTGFEDLEAPHSLTAKGRVSGTPMKSPAPPDGQRIGDLGGSPIAAVRGAAALRSKRGSNVKRGADSQSSTTQDGEGIDPFDPAQFNRQLPAQKSDSNTPPNVLPTPAAKALHGNSDP